jgi:hypothetical protein
LDLSVFLNEFTWYTATAYKDIGERIATDSIPPAHIGALHGLWELTSMTMCPEKSERKTNLQYPSRIEECENAIGNTILIGCFDMSMERYAMSLKVVKTLGVHRVDVAG